MSVQTTADYNLKSANEHITEAIKNISEIVIERCSGSDEYRKDYLLVIQDVLFMLLDVKRKLED